MRKKYRKWFWISILFSTAVLVAVLYFTFDETTVEYLSRIDPLFLILALGLHVAALAVWAAKIQKMAQSLGYRVGFLYCLNLVNANLLIAAITPSQAGGEPVRIHELYAANVRLGDATALVITERILDGFVLAIGGAVTIFLLGTMSLSSWIGWLILAAWIGVISILLIFFYSMNNPDLLKRLAKRASSPFTRKWDPDRVQRFGNRVDCEVDNFHSSLSLFTHQGRRGLLWGTFLTTVFWSLEFLTPSFILMGLGTSPHFVESFVAQIVIAIVMMVPLTPGGSGVAEVSAYSLYALFVDSAIVGIFVMLWRAIFFYFNISLGVLSSIPILRRKVDRLDRDGR